MCSGSVLYEYVCREVPRQRVCVCERVHMGVHVCGVWCITIPKSAAASKAFIRYQWQGRVSASREVWYGGEGGGESGRRGEREEERREKERREERREERGGRREEGGEGEEEREERREERREEGGEEGGGERREEERGGRRKERGWR